MKRWPTTRVCTHITRDGQSCPNLQPCPTHARPNNAPWSTNRDRQAQHHFRQAVLRRDGYQCTRCGHHDPTGRTLEAHHVRPGYDPSAGITVCTIDANGCHRTIDTHAR